MKRINLLSKSRRQDVRFLLYTEMARTVVKITVILICIALLTWFASWRYTLFVESQTENDLAELQQQASMSDYSKLREEIQGINTSISDANLSFKRMLKLSDTLSIIVNILPKEVYLQSISVDAPKNKMTIRGFAKRRESILDLHGRFTADKDTFESVDYPLENLILPTDAPFHFTIILKPGILQRN